MNHKVNVTTNRFYFTLRRIDISPSALRKHTRLAGEERVFKEENQKVCFEWTFFFNVKFNLMIYIKYSLCRQNVCRDGLFLTCK